MVCISANYRLKPTAVFPDYLVDVKKVIAWAREHAAELGADPTTVFVAGSSAGAHLAALAALTPNDPRFQRGFEDANGTVSGAVCLYGYYGPVDRGRQPLPSSPLDYLRAEALPLLIAHGDQDTYVPAERARALAEQLRTISTSPVVYAELPGAQHSFDIFHSIRFETLIDAVEAFTAWIRSRAPAATRPQQGRRDATTSSAATPPSPSDSMHRSRESKRSRMPRTEQHEQRPGVHSAGAARTLGERSACSIVHAMGCGA